LIDQLPRFELNRVADGLLDGEPVDVVETKLKGAGANEDEIAMLMAIRESIMKHGHAVGKRSEK
jgi:hypothetical protein